MKRVLWLGSFLDEKTNQIMVSKGYKNAASYVSQKNLLEGLEVESGTVFDSVNAVAMAGYPRQGGIKMDTYQYSHTDGAIDILVGYINILYLNKLFMKKAMVKAVKEWTKKHYNSGDELDVFVYEMRSACIDAAVYIKRKIPTAKIHLIIPDLPCFMDLNMSKVKRTLKQIDWNQMIRHFDCIDDFLLYAETMVDYLNINHRKWMVIEGSLNMNDIERITEEIEKASGTKQEKNVIMYSGWVDQSFGIDALVDAMEYLDDTYELWITGGGSYEQKLKERVQGNSKIRYYGFLPTREELFKLQAQASVVMNMRDPATEAAHYCFPSKLFEYMLLGKPVLSVRLRGIPEEYGQYLFELDSIDPHNIADGIRNVLGDNEREEKAKAGKAFVQKEKNNFAVARKIIKFVEG